MHTYHDDLLRKWGVAVDPDQQLKADKISSGKLWNTLELQILRKHWPNIKTIELLLPDRSQQAIRQMALTQGLEKLGWKSWTMAEKKILEETYPKFGFDACLEKLPGRTVKAVRNQIAALGLRRVS